MIKRLKRKWLQRKILINAKNQICFIEWSFENKKIRKQTEEELRQFFQKENLEVDWRFEKQLRDLNIKLVELDMKSMIY